MKPRSVSKLKDKSSVVFRVETTFPNNARNDEKFGSYAAHAFIHLSTVDKLKGRRANQECMAIFTHRDVFREKDNPPSVITSTMDFKNPEDAFRVAAFIRDECHLMGGYEHGTDWEKKYRKPIKTRVVMISTRETVHEVVEA